MQTPRQTRQQPFAAGDAQAALCRSSVRAALTSVRPWQRKSWRHITAARSRERHCAVRHEQFYGIVSRPSHKVITVAAISSPVRSPECNSPWSSRQR